MSEIEEEEKSLLNGIIESTDKLNFTVESTSGLNDSRKYWQVR